MVASLLWVAICPQGKQRKRAKSDPLYTAFGVQVERVGIVPLMLDIGVVTSQHQHIITLNISDPSGTSIHADRQAVGPSTDLYHGDFDAHILPFNLPIEIPMTIPGIYIIRALLDGEPLFQLGFPIALQGITS